MGRAQEVEASTVARVGWVPDRCTGHGELRPYSAPPGLVTRRPYWLAPVLLLAFAGAALGIHLELNRLAFWYGRLVSEVAGVHGVELPKQASVAVRPFTVALLVLFAAFAAGSVPARIRLAATALAIYLPLMLGVDILLARVSGGGNLSPFMARGNICDGVVAIVAAGVAFFSVARLPAGLPLTSILRRPKRYLVVLLAALMATVGSIIVIFRFWSSDLRVLAQIPLLAGFFSVIVFFFALLPVFLCLFGFLADLAHGRVVRRPRSDAAPGQPGEPELALPTFGFLIPAHNEEGRIGDCIRAVDDAAAEYPGRSAIYVVENGSSDDTYAEAREALAACRHARGVLLTSAINDKRRAKAHALNTGLVATAEQVIVRVDADTFVSPSLLRRIAPHFGDSSVGGVGAVPLPHKVTIWIERMRALEVYYGAGFKRTSQGAVDAIPVLPGATVAFRRDIMIQVGGFAEGMLGEDADITVRVGRLGYRIVSDPTIRTYSEQPQNFRELRGQRMRWSCGLFHMIGRNRAAIFGLQGLRGTWMMPWACFVMFRKLMLIPFAVAAVGLIIAGHSFFPVREVAAAGAILLGAQLAVMAVVTTVQGGLARLVSLPSYIVFRLIVTYFALETLLTVRLKTRRGCR